MIRSVAVDFDGVIHTYEHGWADGSIYGDFVDGAVFGLSMLMSRYAVFVHTTRSPAQVARWIEQRSGYAFECTTQMTPFLPSWWRWGKRHRFWSTTGTLLVTDRKLPAVAYVDDRAVRFSSWTQVRAELLPEPATDHFEPADRHDPATVALVMEAWTNPPPPPPQFGAVTALLDPPEARAMAVLDALTAAGKLRRSPYAADGEPRCGEPYPGDGPPCQLRPGHDAHARPASGGFDTWRRETDG